MAVHGIYFDGADPVLDNGVSHGRSRPERGIRFSEDPAADGRGRRILVVWVSTPATPNAAFTGAVASDYWLDPATRSGFKRLAAHTNAMCSAATGKIDVAPLSPAQRRALATLLERLSPEGWTRTAPLLKLFLAA